MTSPSLAAWPEREAPLAVLAQRFGLDASQLDRLRVLGLALVADPLAPTSVREPLRVRDDHLADALVALELEVVRGSEMIADLGSGAGVPGIPLAVALPGARLSLVEGNGRKCEFMRGLVDRLALENVSVLQRRVEDWAEGACQFDLVTARAVASLDVVAEYAAPLLKLGGSLVAWRGRREPEDEAAVGRAARVLGLAPAPPLRVEPYPGTEHRHLHVFQKVAETPSRFPRRPGVAAKRPLGRA